jgi:polyisoprenoid-binding protein YceI
MMRTERLPDAGVYRLRTDRCLAEFSVKHMMVKTARGRFAALNGELSIDKKDPLASWVRVDLDAASFVTGLAERDETVCGPDFLDVAEFPVIRFESTFVTETAPGRFDVSGDLYIKDRVGAVDLECRMVTVGPRRVSFEGSGVISRAEFGLTWGPAIERVGAIVADTVKITVAAEFQS